MLSEQLVTGLLAFRAERDWEQFHTAKNLAIAISVEAGELLEQFQWTVGGGAATLEEDRRSRIADEIADVAILLTYLAHDLRINVEHAVAAKLAQNAERYPVSKCRGRASKYNEL